MPPRSQSRTQQAHDHLPAMRRPSSESRPSAPATPLSPTAGPHAASPRSLLRRLAQPRRRSAATGPLPASDFPPAVPAKDSPPPRLTGPTISLSELNRSIDMLLRNGALMKAPFVTKMSVGGRDYRQIVPPVALPPTPPSIQTEPAAAAAAGHSTSSVVAPREVQKLINVTFSVAASASASSAASSSSKRRSMFLPIPDDGGAWNGRPGSSSSSCCYYDFVTEIGAGARGRGALPAAPPTSRAAPPPPRAEGEAAAAAAATTNGGPSPHVIRSYPPSRQETTTTMGEARRGQKAAAAAASGMVVVSPLREGYGYRKRSRDRLSSPADVSPTWSRRTVPLASASPGADTVDVVSVRMEMVPSSIVVYTTDGRATVAAGAVARSAPATPAAAASMRITLPQSRGNSLPSRIPRRDTTVPVGHGKRTTANPSPPYPALVLPPRRPGPAPTRPLPPLPIEARPRQSPAPTLSGSTLPDSPTASATRPAAKRGHAKAAGARRREAGAALQQGQGGPCLPPSSLEAAAAAAAAATAADAAADHGRIWAGGQAERTERPSIQAERVTAIVQANQRQKRKEMVHVRKMLDISAYQERLRRRGCRVATGSPAGGGGTGGEGTGGEGTGGEAGVGLGLLLPSPASSSWSAVTAGVLLASTA
ncbi:MAG: hypothetical protein M1826_003399 [Phylliscum demangeonii]|nr:MAG: hypothetical protein M1826_003399 [Phylliscum demangeonii]